MTSYFEILPNHRFPESIKVPSSKSFLNRVLILGALAPYPITIKNISYSTDVTNMIQALRRVGLQISEQEHQVIIENSFPACEGLFSAEVDEAGEVVLHSGDGGTTNRFLLAMLSRGSKRYRLETTGQFKDRPAGPLLKVVEDLGVRIQRGERPGHWVTVQGPPRSSLPKTLTIDSSQSGQFASAMILAYPEIEIVPTNLNSSSGYVQMTQNLVNDLKRGIVDFYAPVDFSSISYPLAYGATIAPIKIRDVLAIDQYQPDSIFIQILKKMGVKVEMKCHGLMITPSGEDLRSFDLDCSSCPDLVPTLAYMASNCLGQSYLRQLKVLKHKESDRILEVSKILAIFGVTHNYNPQTDILTIKGGHQWPQDPVVVIPPLDHRIIMMSALFMLKGFGGTVYNSHHTEKSYPQFWELFTFRE